MIKVQYKFDRKPHQESIEEDTKAAQGIYSKWSQRINEEGGILVMHYTQDGRLILDIKGISIPLWQEMIKEG